MLIPIIHISGQHGCENEWRNARVTRARHCSGMCKVWHSGITMLLCPSLLNKTRIFMPFVFEPHFPMWPKFPISKYPAEKNEYWLFPLLLASSLPCCRRIFAAHRHHHYASLWTTYGELSWIYPVKTRSTSDLIVMAQWANTLMDHDFYPHIAWGYVSLRIFLYDAYFQLAGTENVHPLSKKSSLSKRLLQSNDMAF